MSLRTLQQAQDKLREAIFPPFLGEPYGTKHLVMTQNRGLLNLFVGTLEPDTLNVQLANMPTY